MDTLVGSDLTSLVARVKVEEQRNDAWVESKKGGNPTSHQCDMMH